MRTTELIQHLRNCSNTELFCTSCDHRDKKGVSFGGGTIGCMCDLMQQAANALEALQAELHDEMHRHDRLQDFEVAESERLAEVKAERDAMKAELKLRLGCGGCKHRCTKYDQEPCGSCNKSKNFPAWEWQGRDGRHDRRKETEIHQHHQSCVGDD